MSYNPGETTILVDTGNIVYFEHNIIIMTSNLGSEYILEGNDELVMKEVKETFRPEFINRMDELDKEYVKVKKILNKRTKGRML